MTPLQVKPLTEEELEQISTVFHQFETGVRSGRIRSGVPAALCPHPRMIAPHLGILPRLHLVHAMLDVRFVIFVFRVNVLPFFRDNPFARNSPLIE
jgi:hypothetical protein